MNDNISLLNTQKNLREIICNHIHKTLNLFYIFLISIMKKYILFFSIFLLTSCSSNSPKEETICTSDYTPVCGKIQIQCFTTPCDPIFETFSNKCVAKNRGATDIIEGECK
jgi:hypothetical protein